jgi:hypothetical protein
MDGKESAQLTIHQHISLEIDGRFNIDSAGIACLVAWHGEDFMDHEFALQVILIVSQGKKMHNSPIQVVSAATCEKVPLQDWIEIMNCHEQMR